MMRLLLCPLLLCASCLAPVPRVTFEAQDTRSTASLRGVSAVSPEVCWASGSGGTFLRTIDGGGSWAAGVVPGAEELDFRDVEALDANSAVLMSAGRPARLYRTTDGGLTWDLVYELDQEGVFLDAMDFSNGHGLAWGDPLDGFFLTLESADNGQTWTRVGGGLPLPRTGEAGFAASGTNVRHDGEHIWIGTGGAAARVLASSDGGSSWRSAPVPLQQGAPSQGTFSVTFVDELRGVVVGGDYARPDATHGTAAYTNDGGRTWRLSAEQPGYRSCVAEIPFGQPSWLMAIGKGGSSLSRNTGANWEPLQVPGHYALDFSPTRWYGDRAVGWAVGAGGSIVRVEVWQ
ncbi:MAG: hypothetical protein O2816_09890 [Planctomycetota bacterium]|nr:hypothetical protein [Planctomycetota bacterium]